MSTIVPMTPARTLATALLCSLAAACGDSGPGEDDELPAAFTVSAALAERTGPCARPDPYVAEFRDARSAMPVFEGSGEGVDGNGDPVQIFCSAFSSDGGVWSTECDNPDVFLYHFDFDMQGAGTLTLTGSFGTTPCSMMYDVTAFTAAE